MDILGEVLNSNSLKTVVTLSVIIGCVVESTILEEHISVVASYLSTLFCCVAGGKGFVNATLMSSFQVVPPSVLVLTYQVRN